MTPESSVKDIIRKTLDSYERVWYFMPVNKFHKGIPDFLGSANGYFFSIEAKANGNKTTLLQDLIGQDIKKSGGMNAVVDETNLEVVSYMINTLLARRAHK